MSLWYVKQADSDSGAWDKEWQGDQPGVPSVLLLRGYMKMPHSEIQKLLEFSTEFPTGFLATAVWGKGPLPGWIGSKSHQQAEPQAPLSSACKIRMSPMEGDRSLLLRLFQKQLLLTSCSKQLFGITHIAAVHPAEHSTSYPRWSLPKPDLEPLCASIEELPSKSCWETPASDSPGCKALVCA